MKKSLIFLISFFSFTHLLGQSWLAENSTWQYDYFNVGGPGGYIEIVYEKDTLFNEINAQKLKITNYDRVIESVQNNVFTYGTDTIPLPSQYVYESNDSIFWYKDDVFSLLYDINAQVGDTFTLPSVDSTTNIIQVDSIGLEDVNGENRRFLMVSQLEGLYGFCGKIIEGIGPIDTYLFPGITSCSFPGYDAYQELSSYSNNDFQYDCNYMGCSIFTSLSNLPSQYPTTIYPNPFDTYITLSNPHTLIESLQIWDIQGNKIKEEKNIQNYTFQLYTQELTKGIYLLQVHTKEGREIIKLIKE